MTDEPYPRLLQEKGFGAFPSLAFMDAQGNVLSTQNGRTVAQFNRTLGRVNNYLALQQRADRGDQTVAEELIETLVDLGRISFEEANQRLEELERVSRMEAEFMQMEMSSLLPRAEAEFQAGRWADACTAYEIITTRNPEDTLALYNLGYSLQQLGALDRSVTAHRRSLAIRRRQSDERETAASLEGLGEVLVQRGDHADAEPMLRECLEIRQRILSADSWLIFNTMSILGASLTGQGKYDVAEPLLLEGYERMSPPEARLARRRRALEHLVELYEVQGKSEQAFQQLGEGAVMLLARSFDPSRAECLGLKGAFFELDRGSIRLRYSFDAPAELNDFTLVANYPHFFNRDALTVGKDADFTIRDGYLVAFGSTCYRLSVPLKAPFILRYGLILTGSYSQFMVGIADDGKDQFIGCAPGGDLFVRDVDDDNDVAATEFQFLVNEEYRVQVYHDGTSVRYLIDGEEVSKATRLGSRTSGDIFLFAHTDSPVIITDLEIEGLLDEDRLDEVRRRWIATELEKIF